MNKKNNYKPQQRNTYVNTQQNEQTIDVNMMKDFSFSKLGNTEKSGIWILFSLLIANLIQFYFVYLMWVSQTPLLKTIGLSIWSFVVFAAIMFWASYLLLKKNLWAYLFAIWTIVWAIISYFGTLHFIGA